MALIVEPLQKSAVIQNVSSLRIGVHAYQFSVPIALVEANYQRVMLQINRYGRLAQLAHPYHQELI